MKDVNSSIQNQSILYEEGMVTQTFPTTLFTRNNGIHPNAIDADRINHYAMYNSKEGVYHGITAIIAIYAYFPVQKNQMSSSLLWVVNGVGDTFNSIEYGWHIYPEMYGDNETHLFVHWTADGYEHTGCYNLQCPGFVLNNSTFIKPGAIMTTTNVRLTISQNPSTGDWWLYAYDRAVGHFPKNLFSTLANGANHVALGGMVSFIKNENSPPMGNGYFPSTGDIPGALNQAIKLVDEKGGEVYPSADDFIAFQDATTCYRVDPIGDSNLHDGLFFYYGGPGNCVQ